MYCSMFSISSVRVVTACQSTASRSAFDADEWRSEAAASGEEEASLEAELAIEMGGSGLKRRRYAGSSAAGTSTSPSHGSFAELALRPARRTASCLTSRNAMSYVRRSK